MIGQRKRLGDLLVDAHKVTKDQLKDMLAKQRGSGKKLGEILITEGLITENEIMEVLEKQLNIKRIQVFMTKIDKKAIMTIPETLAKKYSVMPVDFQGNKMRVAMADPLNVFAIDDLRIASGYEIEPLIATNSEIVEGIDRYYSTRIAEQVAEQLQKEAASKQEEQKQEQEIINFDDVKNAPIVKLVDTIFSNAINYDASDIHIEPFNTFIKVRYRIDGSLQEMYKIPKESLAPLVTRIKIMAELNIAEKRIPQDGRIITNINGVDIDLRISVLPTVYGEKIVARILKKDTSFINKKALGLEDDDLEKLDSIIQSPNGIVLVTGPTGSGKSTTLYTILSELNTDDKNIITIEDPAEILLEGINQVNVNTKAGLTFATGLRSILRQDPDIVMVGEIRDGETARIATRAAITGHLVLTTLHTNDSASAVVRLTDMDIEPYLVATSIQGVIAQRLVKKICPHCKREYEASDREKNILGIDTSKNLTLYKGSGCEICNGKGYMGRKGVYEIMPITSEHRELINRNASTEEIRKLNKKLNVKTIKDSCSKLVLEGITTMDELVKIAFLSD